MGHLLLRRSWLLPSAPSCQVFIDMGDISVPSLLQTEQLQLPQPFLMGSPVPSSSGPLARSVPVCPRLLYWAPSIYPTVSPQCRGEGSDLLEMLAYGTQQASGCVARGCGAGLWSAWCLPGFQAAGEGQGSSLQVLPAPGCPGWEGAGFLASTGPGTRWGKELNPAFYCPDAIALQSAVQGHRLGGEKTLCSAFGNRGPSPGTGAAGSRGRRALLGQRQPPRALAAAYRAQVGKLRQGQWLPSPGSSSGTMRGSGC